MKNAIILFLLGAILGPILDGLHSHSDTLAYLHPFVFKMAIWVPPLFGMAALLIGTNHLVIDQFWKRPKHSLSWTFVITGIAVFAVIYFISGFWKVDTITKTLVMALLAFGYWFFFDRSLQGLIDGIITGICGSAFESLLSSTGVFYYLEPDIYGIPYWLFFLYIPAAIAVGNLGRKLFSE